MKTQRGPINWHEVERIALRAFQGHPLSEAEERLIQDAWRREPEEYRKRTKVVRDEERDRIRW